MLVDVQEDELVLHVRGGLHCVLDVPDGDLAKRQQLRQLRIESFLELRPSGTNGSFASAKVESERQEGQQPLVTEVSGLPDGRAGLTVVEAILSKKPLGAKKSWRERRESEDAEGELVRERDRKCKEIEQERGAQQRCTQNFEKYQENQTVHLLDA